MQLTEKYRPSSWGEVVGLDKIVARVRQLSQRGLAGRAYWISGQSGTGKTTIARLIAQDVASEWDTEEIDAGALTCAALRDWSACSPCAASASAAAARFSSTKRTGCARMSFAPCVGHCRCSPTESVSVMVSETPVVALAVPLARPPDGVGIRPAAALLRARLSVRTPR
jgi:DNA polymerase-3 subunit gamma/tau